MVPDASSTKTLNETTVITPQAVPLTAPAAEPETNPLNDRPVLGEAFESLDRRLTSGVAFIGVFKQSLKLLSKVLRSLSQFSVFEHHMCAQIQKIES